MVAAVCVIIPHTQQSHFARGSLDVMGRVCIALGEVHTWAALPFPAFESLHAEPHATQAGARATQPGTVLCPTPLETNPKTSLSPMGTTDSLPSAVQAALQGNRRQGTHSGEPSWRPGHPQTHTRPPHCIFCWALLRKHCHQPQALLGLCPYHSVPGRDAKLSQTLSQWDDGVPDCNWERTERLAGSSSLPSSHRSHTAQPRLVTTVFI